MFSGIFWSLILVEKEYLDCNEFSKIFDTLVFATQLERKMLFEIDDKPSQKDVIPK